MGLSNEAFAAFLTERWRAKDGYIMGAVGEDPKIWTKGSWRIAQYADAEKYTAKQYEKALYWWKNCARVWDCQGLADGYVTENAQLGKVNVKARDNYASWCSPKGKGLIPEAYRVAGAAVFWGDSASKIHHVGFLAEPVQAGKTDGDWYMIEARGVLYGVVRTRLYERKPNFWGWMTRYFDYEETKNYTVTGGSVYLWSAPPESGGEKIKTVHRGDALEKVSTEVYAPVRTDGKICWINRKYLKGGS